MLDSLPLLYPPSPFPSSFMSSLSFFLTLYVPFHTLRLCFSFFYISFPTPTPPLFHIFHTTLRSSIFPFLHLYLITSPSSFPPFFHSSNRNFSFPLFYLQFIFSCFAFFPSLPLTFPFLAKLGFLSLCTSKLRTFL